jgi:hypothetical protein
VKHGRVKLNNVDPTLLGKPEDATGGPPVRLTFNAKPLKPAATSNGRGRPRGRAARRPTSDEAQPTMFDGVDSVSSNL